MNRLYVEKSVQKLLKFLLIVGGLNWGIKSVAKRDAVSYVLGENTVASRVVFGLVGLTALWFAFRRNFYLPFLGDTVVPTGLLKETKPADATRQVTVQTEPNTKVVYWSSEPNTKVVSTPWSAYKTYENAGVTISDGEGRATLHVRSPSSYKTPWGRTLRPHVHWRCVRMGGMLSEIKTTFFSS